MREEPFVAFARAESDGLVRLARLLTGSQHAAEDLVQETLVRVFVHWGKVERADSPRAYARRMMTNVFLRQRERARPRTESLDDAVAPAVEGGFAGVDARDQAARALVRLPVRQRTAVVLRHYEHMTESETARAMGCSAGTVKSLTSRGLAALRELLADSQDERSSR